MDSPSRAAERAPDAAARASAANRLLLPLVGIWLLVVLYAAFWAPFFGPRSVGEPVGAYAEHQNNFLLLFHQDLPVSLLLAALTIGVWLLLRRGAPMRFRALPRPGLMVALLAAAGFALAWFGRVQAHHLHDMVVDEMMVWFQSRIFLEGALAAPIHSAWADFAEVLQPRSVQVDATGRFWVSGYRPGYALLRAAAAVLGGDALLNPTLVAGAVLLVAHVARVVLPDRPGAPLLAAALLVASPQVVATAATGMSFTAHLFFALLWLALFLRGDLRGHAGAALVGAFAIGLHQVHVHLLFAAPFLLAHLFGHYGRSLASLGLYALIYAVALLGWMAWPGIAFAVQSGDIGALPVLLRDFAYLRGYSQYAEAKQAIWLFLVLSETPANLARLAAWLSPALVMLALFGHRRLRELPLTVRLAAVSFWLVVVAHALLMPHQTHGWGYRFANPVLGNLVLIAVAAFPRAGVERAVAGVATAAFLAVSLLVLMPWRLMQVETKLGPRAAAEAFIAGLDADVVLVEDTAIWFGIDLVRNDPLLRNRPLVMSAPRLTEAQRAALAGLRVVRVGPADLRPLGIGRGDWVEPVLRGPRGEVAR